MAVIAPVVVSTEDSVLPRSLYLTKYCLTEVPMALYWPSIALSRLRWPKHWPENALHMSSESPSISPHKRTSCSTIKSCHLQVYAYFFEEVLLIAPGEAADGA
jgi:hypothetical protein